MLASFPQPIFAAGVTLPMVLWGAALGCIPIIIHLLHKRKYRETNWAAMRFLLEAARKNSRRLRLEQLILLCVRTLILLFLVAGLQGMYFESTLRRSESGGPTHRIIVVDASFSMQYRPNLQASRFDAARQTAKNIVESAHPGDLLSVLLITGQSKRQIISTPAQSRKWVLERIADSGRASGRADLKRPGAPPASMPRTATQERGRLLPTLADVRALVKKTALKRTRVYFISDFQKVTWSPPSQELRRRIRDSMKTISEDASLMMIDVGDKSPVNTAITKLETVPSFAVAGKTVRFRATIRNFSSQELPARRVELYVDGRLSDVKSVDLDPKSEKLVSFSYPPANSPNAVPQLAKGEHYVEVRLADDRLSLDNVRGLSLPVKEELRVLLVNGKPGTKPRDDATFYLQMALSPAASSQEWKGLIKPRMIGESDLMGTDLSNVDCIFLCNVQLFRKAEARKLRAFAESGGGIVFCLGDQIEVENYNAVLYRDGDGILPAEIGKQAAEGDALRKPSHLYRFETARLDHPILNPFVGNPGYGLEKALCFQYFRTEIPKESSARAVLRFRKTSGDPSGDPVIIEMPIGQGRSILLTTSVDPPWSTWAINPCFLPLMHEIVHFAVAGRWNRRQFVIGEPLERGFPNSAANMPKTIDVKRPDGRIRPVLISERDRWRIRRGGADYFETPPSRPDSGKLKPPRRIPAKTRVRKLERRQDFSLVQWQGKTSWVRNERLERIGYSGLFFPETLSSGKYEMLLPPALGQREVYAVNVDPLESDLTPVSERGLRSDVMPGVSFSYRRSWRDDSPSFHAATTQQSSLTRWLLLAAVCLVLVEQLMAWRFFVGLALLGLFVSAEFSRQAFHWSTLTGIVMSTLLAGLLLGVIVVSRKRSRPKTRRIGSIRLSDR